ncbi:hypothetical protein LAZ67_5004106 [Cordylochernes scorpioides]|uniref:Uncharacterized protein n=1 Tax=Cordylochernes scorpioides TaxID=51811 RepID=A0ABY6KKT1_9ARAC|nr:hypothetical protein LAZ67_5004106 [Cordylochernes scorpioides]
MNIANEMLDSVRDDPNLLQRVITGDEAGVVHHEFLPQDRTVNEEYYLQKFSKITMTRDELVDIEVRRASVDRIVDAKGREEDPKEPMESDPDSESGGSPTFPKKENALGRTQEVPPGQEDVTPPPPVSDVLGRLTTTLHQLSAVTGHRERWNRYDGSYEAQSFFDNYDAQADLAQLHYTDRLRKPPDLLQAPLRITNTRAYVTCSPDHL